MTPPRINSIPPQSRHFVFRNAVLTSFSRPQHEVASDFAPFSKADWKSQSRWLDVSGLALYLLDRLTELHLEHLIPDDLRVKLHTNLADNRKRNAALLQEAVKINQSFQNEKILYANVKGITLVPDSVPDYGLRCQLDLDFVVVAEHADRARHVLETMGYELHCVAGHTLDFRTSTSEVAFIDDLYKVKPQKTVEIHLAPPDGILARSYPRMISGTPFFVFSPVDIFLAQAKHLFKHLSSAHTRVAWLLEARRHMLARQPDEAFWRDVADAIADDPKAAMALAFVTLLMEDVFEDAPTTYLTGLIEKTVPPPVRLWLQRYGCRCLLADIPGTKLYLLLLAVLPSQFKASRSLRNTHLLPLHRPPMITSGYAGEPIFSKLNRYRIQVGYIFFRTRFHCVAGAAYFFESYRFGRLLKTLDRDLDCPQRDTRSPLKLR